MPVPSAPPPGPALAVRARRGGDDSSSVATASKVAAAAPAPGSRTAVNDLLPFLDFVERHPVGTACTVVIESYASHGAYARSGDVLVYLPLRLMGDPQPRSARTAVTIGEAISVVIVGYVPERRSIDAALPSASDAAARTVAAPAAVEPAPTKRRGRAAKPNEPAAAEVEQPVAAADVVADVVADVALTPDSAGAASLVPKPRSPESCRHPPSRSKRHRHRPRRSDRVTLRRPSPSRLPWWSTSSRPTPSRPPSARRRPSGRPPRHPHRRRRRPRRSPRRPLPRRPWHEDSCHEGGCHVDRQEGDCRSDRHQGSRQADGRQEGGRQEDCGAERAGVRGCPPKRTRAAKAAPKKGTAG